MVSRSSRDRKNVVLVSVLNGPVSVLVLKGAVLVLVLVLKVWSWSCASDLGLGRLVSVISLWSWPWAFGLAFAGNESGVFVKNVVDISAYSGISEIG